MEKNIRHTEELEDEKPIERTSVFERFQFNVTFDKLVIASISMVVLLAVTFAVGVERGKQKVIQANAKLAAESSTKTVIQQEWSAKTPETQTSAQTDTTVSNEVSQTSTETDGTSSFGEPNSETQNSAAMYPQDLAPQVNPSVAQDTKSKMKKQDQAKTVKKSIENQNKKYTIRVASYIKQAAAKSTADKLKKKGYQTFVKQSGKYFVLNVGRFSEKQSAQDTLLRLRRELRVANEGVIRTL
ncbi:MAG: SPOR domain-containing protein [Candidatus Omnitrophica bacterium]|nr:SPOR domain-containing protein [Candidatus Omnitrophota bacterium]